MVKYELLKTQGNDSALELFNSIKSKIDEFDMKLPRLEAGKSSLILHSIDNDEITLVFLKRDITNYYYYFEYIHQKGYSEAKILNSTYFLFENVD